MLKPVSNGPQPPLSPTKQLILRLAGELARLHDSQPSTLDLIAEARAYLAQPGPPSLKEQAMTDLTAAYNDDKIDDTTYENIRRALEQLDD